MSSGALSFSRSYVEKGIPLLHLVQGPEKLSPTNNQSTECIPGNHGNKENERLVRFFFRQIINVQLLSVQKDTAYLYALFVLVLNIFSKSSKTQKRHSVMHYIYKVFIQNHYTLFAFFCAIKTFHFE